jgi:hypothetical protein
MMTEQADWEQTLGLAPDTTRVSLTCTKDDREEWSREASRQGYGSRSQYLYELIQEARAYREAGFLAHHDSDERIEQLETQVDHLEQQLARERQESSGRLEIDDPVFLKQFLCDEYQTLGELSKQIVESGVLDDLIRERIEDRLYFLASQGTVEYEPGWGWKLSDTEA